MFIRHYWKPIVLLTALSMRDRTPSLHVHTSKWINVHKSWLALLYTVIVFSCPQKFWTFRINRCIFVNMILWCVQTNVHMTLTQSNPITSSHSSLKLYFSATSTTQTNLVTVQWTFKGNNAWALNTLWILSFKLGRNISSITDTHNVPFWSY